MKFYVVVLLAFWGVTESFANVAASSRITQRNSHLGDCGGGFLTDSAFLTAAHCVSRERAAVSIRVGAGAGAQSRVEPILPSQWDRKVPEVFDMAVVIFPAGTSQETTPISAAAPAEGEQVVIQGISPSTAHYIQWTVPIETYTVDLKNTCQPSFLVYLGPRPDPQIPGDGYSGSFVFYKNELVGIFQGTKQSDVPIKNKVGVFGHITNIHCNHLQETFELAERLFPREFSNLAIGQSKIQKMPSGIRIPGSAATMSTVNRRTPMANRALPTPAQFSSVDNSVAQSTLDNEFTSVDLVAERERRQQTESRIKAEREREAEANQVKAAEKDLEEKREQLVTGEKEKMRQERVEAARRKKIERELRAEKEAKSALEAAKADEVKRVARLRKQLSAPEMRIDKEEVKKKESPIKLRAEMGGNLQ